MNTVTDYQSALERPTLSRHMYQPHAARDYQSRLWRPPRPSPSPRPPARQGTRPGTCLVAGYRASSPTGPDAALPHSQQQKAHAVPGCAANVRGSPRPRRRPDIDSLGDVAGATYVTAHGGRVKMAGAGTQGASEIVVMIVRLSIVFTLKTAIGARMHTSPPPLTVTDADAS